jgi:hypothetical protein
MKKTALKSKVETKAKPASTRPEAEPREARVCPMVAGKYYRFMFPRHNFSGIVSRLEERYFRCDSIRDLRKQPIERITFEIQPLLRRGRFLVTGWDLDKQEERSFYCNSMQNIVEIDPPPNDRTDLTVFVVGTDIFTEEACAAAAAEVSASLTGIPIPIEVIQIARTMRRELLRTIEPIPRYPAVKNERRKARGKASVSLRPRADRDHRAVRTLFDRSAPALAHANYLSYRLRTPEAASRYPGRKGMEFSDLFVDAVLSVPEYRRKFPAERSNRKTAGRFPANGCSCGV